MVLRLGRFFARSTMATRVPITGPSTVKSAKIPAVWTALRGCDFDFDFVDMLSFGGINVRGKSEVERLGGREGGGEDLAWAGLDQSRSWL